MLFLALLLVVTILTNILWSTVRLGITPTPSNSAMRKTCSELLDTILNRIKTHMTTQNPQHELTQPTIIIAGSGWGGLGFFLAKHYKGSIICYEAAFVPWLCSRVLYAFGHTLGKYPADIQIIRKNTSKMKASENSIIICYLFPEGTQKLYQQIIESQPQPIGFISIAFAVNHVPATIKLHAQDWMKTPLYWYKI